MPFRPKTELLPNPSVRIFFTGIMIIQPDENGDMCEVFVNRAALDHHVSIEVREKRIGKPDVVMLRCPVPLAFIADKVKALHGLIIESIPPKGVEKYMGTLMQGGEDTLALAIDLNDPMYHGAQPIEVDVSGGRPSISLNAGIFYTADKTPEGLIVRLKKGNAASKNLEPFANLIGANVYLEGKESLQITWLEMGLPRTLTLEKPKDGNSYEIYILNEPYYVPDKVDNTHDEFKEYYKILSPVPDDEQIKFEVEIPEELEHELKGTPRTLCMCLIMKG